MFTPTRNQLTIWTGLGLLTKSIGVLEVPKVGSYEKFAVNSPLILRFLPNLLALCHRVVAGILNISEALVKDKRPSFKQSKAKSMSWVV